MTIAQLPLSAAMLNPGDHQSALGSYLASHLKSSRTGLAYDLVRPVMEGALAVAAMQSFDTEEKITIQRGTSEPETRTLIEAVLLLTNSHHTSGVLRQWPSSPSQFGPHLDVQTRGAGNYGVDTEWVAAALTAAGCNPWKGFEVDDNDLPNEVRLAIVHGFGGLVDMFLDCPGAPSAQWLSQTKLTAASVDLNWVVMAKEPASNAVLEVLLKRGARLAADAVLIKVLSDATPRAVELFAEHNPMQMPASSRQKVEAAWKERSTVLGSDTVEKMQMMAWGNVSTAMSTASLDVANLLSVEWGKAPSGSSSQAYDFMGGEGASKLIGRASLKSGPLSGQWSVLAAAVGSRLRQGGEYGALGWSASTMLEHHFDQAQRRWISADCTVAPHEGSLRDALGFDWRPGISVDGIVALSLFGQRGSDPQRRSKDDLLEKVVFDDIAKFGAAAGIDDPILWANANAQAAAAFTCHVLKSPKVNAAKCFLHTWETALYRNPGMAHNIPVEVKVELLQALVAKFKLSTPWSSMQAQQSNAFAGIAALFFPELGKAPDLASPTLTGPLLRAALVIHLATPGQTGSTASVRLDAISCRQHDLSRADLDLVSAWVDSLTVSEQDAKLMKATLEQWHLNQTTPQAPSSRRGPRL